MYRILSKKLVVAAIVWLALGLAMLGQSLGDFFKLDFKLTSIPLLVWLLLNALLWNPVWRWFWRKIPKLNELIFPDLNGIWEVELCSNWPRQAQMLNAAASTEHVIDMRRCAEGELAALTPIKLEAEIHQTWFGFDMLLNNPRGDTPIDRSDTISVDPFPRVGLRRPGICYFYKQVNATDNVADEALLRNPMTTQTFDYLVILCSADGNGRSYFGEAIEDCGAHFEFVYLTLEGARSDA